MSNRYGAVVRGDGLTYAISFASFPYHGGRELRDWHEACLVEATHRPPVDGTDFMQSFYRFVDGSERFTAILLAHSLLPR